MKQLKLMALLVTSIVVTTGVCAGIYELTKPESNTSANDPNQKYEKPILGNISELSEALNIFSFEIYKEFIKSGDENIFFSPYSIFIALAMTYEGARGQTAEEMMSILHIAQNNTSILNSVKQLYEFLNQNQDFTISTANALWIRENLDLLLEYSNIIDNYYMGNPSKVNFSNAEEAARIINEWVEEQTNEKIKDLVTPTDVFKAALVLTNAIYFKGDWKVQFDPENTKDLEFKLPSGETITVPTMCMEGSEELFNYTETEELQILELQYVGGDLSMIILLPKEKNVTGIVETLSLEQLSEWKKNFSETQVDIYLPKFKLETEYDLEKALKDMGMVIPFSMDGADFSGIFPNKNDLYISKVIHKAFVEVNEEGTEAAAATAVIIFDNCIASYTTFRADHPFIFLIQEKGSGSILFMGNVGNPTA